MSGTSISAPTGFFNGSPGNSQAAQDLQNAIVEAIAMASGSSGVANVKVFGAKGNGTTNDTAAIQKAAASLAVTGGTLLLPPGGKYLINDTTLLPSNVVVDGSGATIVAALRTTWPNAGGPTGCTAFINKDYTATTLADSNIIIRGVVFDYQARFASNNFHILQLIRVQNVVVEDCVFLGASDAVAMQGCYNSLIKGCAAYGFANCAYDHWAGSPTPSPTGPMNARVIGCYAETASAAQFVNFNPEFSAVSGSTGNVADGFVLQGCEFVCTGTGAVPIQIEPLSAGTFVKNVTITGNVFKNVLLACRGATRGVTISGNEFVNVSGSASTTASIESVILNAGTPDAINIIGNVFIDPAPSSTNEAVIVLTATSSSIAGNTISGVLHYASVFLGTAGTTAVSGNNFDPGLNGFLITGPGAWVTSAHQINGTIIGDKSPSTGAFTTLSASGGIDSTAIGATSASSGRFTSLSATSGINSTAIGATAASSGRFTSLLATSGLNSTAVGNTAPSTGSFTAALLGNPSPSPTMTGNGSLPYIPSCPGAPTGSPTVNAGYAPIVVDNVNSKLWVFTGGVWKGVAIA